MPKIDGDFPYKTEEGLWARNKGEEGVREQQKEWKGMAEYFKGKSCRSVIDFGAHVGWFVWYAMNTFNPERILCVECAPNQLELLKQNVPDNTEVFAGAVVNDDYAKPTIDLYLGRTYSSCDSITPVKGRKIVTVRAIKMQQILKRMPNPQAIKLDMEGAEYEINWLKHMPKSVEFVAAELHHQRPGHLEKQRQFHKDLLRLGFKCTKEPKENTFYKTCHVWYQR